MIRNVVTNFSARLSVAALNFFMLLMTTHVLGASVRGEISIIQLGVTIIHLVSDLAGGPSLTYLTPRTSLRKLLLAGSAWASFTSIGLGVAMLFLDLLPGAYGKEVIVMGLLISLHSLNQNILLGQQRIRAFNILFLLQGVSMFTVMAVCIFAGLRNAYPYIYAGITAYGVCYIAGLFIVHYNAPAPSIREDRPILFLLFRNGIFAQTASIFMQISIRQSYYLLEKSPEYGTSAVGIYSTAVSLGEAILLLSASVAAVLMSRVSNQQDPATARAEVLRWSKFSVGLTILACGFFLLLPAEFFTFVIGKEFGPIKTVFMTLTPGIVLVSFGTVFSHYFSGAGKHYMNFISSIFAVIAAFSLTALLIREFGIEGAGWSATIAYGLISIVIFIAFMLVGGNKRSDWKQLLPDAKDVQALREIPGKIFKHKKF